jgi:hypothetical protein
MRSSLHARGQAKDALNYVLVAAYDRSFLPSAS